MTLQLDSIGQHRHPAHVSMHRHPHNELIVMLNGRCHIALAGHDHELAAGQGLLIPAGQEHDQRDHGSCNNYYLKFHGSIDDLQISPRRLDHDDDLIPRWCRDLELLLHRNDLASGNALLCAILSHLAQREAVEHQAAILPAGLNRALHFIEEQYTTYLDSHDIAKAAGISTSHLNLLFRNHLQNSPGTHLLTVRMRHARRLLRDDYRSISEVAAAVGLPDANYFARRFRREHGCSPRQWRQRTARPSG